MIGKTKTKDPLSAKVKFDFILIHTFVEVPILRSPKKEIVSLSLLHLIVESE